VRLKKTTSQAVDFLLRWERKWRSYVCYEVPISMPKLVICHLSIWRRLFDEKARTC